MTQIKRRGSTCKLAWGVSLLTNVLASAWTRPSVWKVVQLMILFIWSSSSSSGSWSYIIRKYKQTSSTATNSNSLQTHRELPPEGPRSLLWNWLDCLCPPSEVVDHNHGHRQQERRRGLALCSGVEEKLHRRPLLDLQLPAGLDPSSGPHHHVVLCFCHHVWPDGLQDHFRWEVFTDHPSSWPTCNTGVSCSIRIYYYYYYVRAPEIKTISVLFFFYVGCRTDYIRNVSLLLLLHCLNVTCVSVTLNLLFPLTTSKQTFLTPTRIHSLTSFTRYWTKN